MVCTLQISLVCFVDWMLHTLLICRIRWRVLSHIIKQLIPQIVRFSSLPKLLNLGQPNHLLLRHPLCLPSPVLNLKLWKMMEEHLWHQFLELVVLLRDVLSLLVSVVEDVLARGVYPSPKVALICQSNLSCRLIDFYDHFWLLRCIFIMIKVSLFWSSNGIFMINWFWFELVIIEHRRAGSVWTLIFVLCFELCQ